MRKLLITLSCMLLAMQSYGQDFETATEAVRNMGVGWNLGNTLDAHNNGVQQGVDSETYWGQPVTKLELIQMMKKAGFKAIRVPVTWYNHMDSDGNVDAVWMARVKEVVDYVIDEGLYCLLNVHHDTGEGSVHWLHASMNTYNSVKARYEHLWQQIAETFKDYDHHLLFESYNEMLDDYNSWCFASFNTSGKYNATVAADAYNAINSYAQSFVTTVRNTGGNNAKRNLVVNTYAAANGGGSWSTYLQDPIKKMTYPQDDAGAGHIAFQVHAYPTLDNGKAEIDDMVNQLSSYLLTKGPVILGEWGSSNVDAAEPDYYKYPTRYLEFAKYMVEKTKAKGIASFYWMGLSDGAARSFPVFSQADLAETIIKAYYGSSEGFEFPTATSQSSYTCFEGEKVLVWGNGNVIINNTLFSTFDKTVKLVLTYTATKSGADIQLYYGGWTAKVPFVIGTTTYQGDYGPTGSTGTTTTTITFSESVYTQLTQKGLIIHGDGITLKKVVLESGSTGITPLTFKPDDGRVYNLHGQQVAHPQKGIYISNGRKFVKR